MSGNDQIRDAQRKTWNKFSSGWQKWDDFVMSWFKVKAEGLMNLAGLKPGMDVLDVATGTGEPGLSAARRVTPGKVVAVDVAEDMIAIAEAKGNSQGLANFRALAYDGL